MALTNMAEYQAALKYFMHYVKKNFNVSFGILDQSGTPSPDARVSEDITRVGWPASTSDANYLLNLADVQSIMSDFLTYEQTRDIPNEGYDGSATTGRTAASVISKGT